MSALGAGFFSNLKMFPTLLPDAVVINVTGGNPPVDVFSYPKLRDTGLLYRARYAQWSDPGSSGVNLTFAADGFVTNPLDAQAASAFDPFVDGWRETTKMQATGNLRWAIQSLADANNSETAPTLTNWWANWAVEVVRPTLAERIAFPAQLPPLTPAEADLAARFGLTGPNARADTMPRGLGWIVENEIRNNILDAYMVAENGATSSTSSLLVCQEQVRGDQCLFLAGISTSPGSGSDGLTVKIGIDSDTPSFWSAPAYGLCSGKPIRCLIPAEQSVTVELTSTAAVSKVQAAAVIWRVRLTDVLRARLGLLTEGPVFDRVTAGVA